MHHAGGGAAGFRAWPRLLDPFIQLGTVVLPGRERLAGLLPITDFGVAVQQVFRELRAHAEGRAYSLFGHSLGAVVAFEVACRLEREGFRPPAALIVAGREAPHDAPREVGDERPTSELPDAELIDLMRDLGGTPTEVFESPELLALVLARMRADFRLAENYRWTGSKLRRCPILALGGNDDSSVDPNTLTRWGEVTGGGLTVRVFNGGHFFVNSEAEGVCRTIADFVRSHTIASA